MKNFSFKRTNLIFSIIFLLVSIMALSELRDNLKADNGSQAIGLNVEYHSQEDIKSYIANYGTNYGLTEGEEVVYDEEPLNTPPYSLGKVSRKTLESALRTLNQMRYIAGISYDVQLNDRYNELAQAASIVSLANDYLSHFPDKPEGVPDNIYELGKNGASKSNLGRGHKNINQSIVLYMGEGIGNIDTVGHRRWILNPPMKETGFGYAYKYTALYALDNASNSEYKSPVVWPAQNMPLEYVHSICPWSISVGYEINSSDIQVELVRLSDNKVWRFSSLSADGYFNVNNDGYGQKGCIIFDPDIGNPDDTADYWNGDKFRVTVTGLKEPLSYQVSFFNLYPEDLAYYTKLDFKEALTYTGKAVDPEIVVKYNDKLLKKDEDYILEYEDNINCGRSNFKVKGINNYRGEETESFYILCADGTACNVIGIKDKEYTGGEVEQNLVVKNTEGQILEEDKDYELEYDNNIEVGEAKVTVCFKRNYEGEIPLKFKILPASEEEYNNFDSGMKKKRAKKKNKQNLETVNSEKNEVLITYKNMTFLSKSNKQILTVKMINKIKYKLMYSENKDMKSNKIITLNADKKVIDKLKVGKTYYIKIGTVKSGKTKWGKIKKIVVK